MAERGHGAPERKHTTGGTGVIDKQSEIDELEEAFAAPSYDPKSSAATTETVPKHVVDDLEASFLLSPDEGLPDGDFDATKLGQKPQTDTATPEPAEPSHGSGSDEKFNIVIVGLDRNIRAHAIEEASRVLSEKTAGEGFVGILKNLYKGKGIKGKFRHLPKHVAEAFRQTVHGNLAREIVLGEEFMKAQRAIIEHKNLLLHEGGEAKDYELATLFRFGEAADEYEELVQSAAGEKRTKLSLDLNEEGHEDSLGKAVKLKFRSLMEQVVAGNFDDPTTGAFNRAAFDEAEKEVMSTIALNPELKDYVGKAQLYTANLYEMAMAIRAHHSAMRAENPDAKLEDILNNTVVHLGEAQVGAHTETERGLRERIADGLSRVPLFNETAIVGGVSTAIASSSWYVKRTLGIALAAHGALGVGAGVFAGLRSINAARQERVLRKRRQTRGEEDPLGGERLFAAKNAGDLMDQLNLLYDEETGEFRTDDPMATMQIIAETTARLRLSGRRKDDFISYEQETEDGRKPADQRMDLLVALSKAKTDLRKVLRDAIATGDDDVLKAYGIAEDALADVKAAGDPLEAVLEPTVEGNEGVLTLDILGEINQDIREKNKAHRKFLASQFAKGFLAGAIAGLTFGIVAQETAALWINKQNGIFNNHKGAGRETVLRRGMNNISRIFKRDEKSTTITNGPNTEQISSQTNVVTAGGIEVTQKGDSFTVTGPNGLNVENIHFTSGGNLTDESLKALNEKGIHVGTGSPDYVTPEAAPPTEAKVNGHEWAKLHEDDMTSVKRDWMNNRTPMYKGADGKWHGADLNELRLNDPHLQKDGIITVSMGRMVPGDSFNDHSEVEWQNPRRIAFTISDGTSDKVIFREVDSHGVAHITKDDPLYSLFKHHGTGDKSRMQFTGKWTQAISDRGPDAHGVHHVDVMATDIGAKDKTFTTLIPHEPEPVPVTPITLEYKPELPPVLVPPVVPIYARRGLSFEQPNNPYGRLNGYEAQRLADSWLRNRSPRLKDDPEAKLDINQELSWYFDKHSPEYKAELARRTAASEALRKMGSNTELMISIPVAAAYEQGNIYKTLSLYSTQDAESLSQTQFVLSLNWKEGSNADDIKLTIAEVMRAQRDFPQLNISFFTEEWPQEFVAEKNGAIYGTVIKSLYDTSMWAVQEANQRAAAAGEAPIDPLIVTNDADPRRISRNYLRQLIRSRERSPDADVLMGKIHWGSDAFKDYPGYGVVSSFFMLLEDRVRDTQNVIAPASWGPNSAFVASSVAAVGGVNGDMGAGADSELGKRIIAARRPASAIRIVGTPSYGGGIPLDIAGGVVADTARGAWVDSSPERLLNLYKTSTSPLTNAWNNFDTGGYTPRPELKLDNPEDVDRDFDAIKQRIEFQFSGILSSNWTIVDDQSVVDAALENMFFKPSGVQLWTMVGDRYNRQFKFTPEGEKELRTVLKTIHTSVQEGLEMIDEIHEAAATGTAPASSAPAPAPTPEAVSTEEQRAINQLDHIASDPGLSVVDADVIVEGHRFTGRMIFERIDPDHGDYLFMPEGNRSGDTWFALPREEMLKLLQEGAISPAAARP